MGVVIILTTAIISYIIGSFSSAVVLSKAISGKDIRQEGSGNAGATNMLRVHGKLAGVLTLIIDVLKGVVAILVAWLLNKWLFAVDPGNIFNNNLQYIAGVFVVLGHDFPIFFKFKGGKGVATSLGVTLMFGWEIGLIVLAVAILVMATTRYVSLGSISAAVVCPILVLGLMIGEKNFNVIFFVAVLIMAFMLVIKHHANIGRLIKGTESKLFSKKDKE